jgi:hypothetical protein
MTIFRLYYEVRGGHVHCRLFAGPREGALGKCGDLTMRIEEFERFKEAAGFIQFRKEDR